jgi:hypothetical protein
MTAKMSVAAGHSAANGGSYPLFAVGATCWYFAQRLSELGVDVPIGIANTAIGGQRIEEYMSNASINTCTGRSSGPPHSPGRDWDARHFADMVSPFLDMTVKGWTWYRASTWHPPPPPQRCFASDTGLVCRGREQHDGDEGQLGCEHRLLLRAACARRRLAQGVSPPTHPSHSPESQQNTKSTGQFLTT